MAKAAKKAGIMDMVEDMAEEAVEAVENTFESVVHAVEDVIASISDSTKAELEAGKKSLEEYNQRMAAIAADEAKEAE